MLALDDSIWLFLDNRQSWLTDAHYALCHLDIPIKSGLPRSRATLLDGDTADTLAKAVTSLGHCLDTATD